MSNNKSKSANPIHSLIAGTTAGVIEGTLTYPTEFVKTQLQLQSKTQPIYKGPVDCLVQSVRTKGITSVYKGLTPMVIGNGLKAGVRFLSFDTLKNLFRSSDGTLSKSGALLAGLGCGVIEGSLVVTPTETIKTRLIVDSNSKTPQFRGMMHGISSIWQSEGLKGIYRGIVPVTMRQGANSTVRMTSYSLMRQSAENYYKGAKVPTYATFGIGMVAGIITVYSTMPVDVIKTRLQSGKSKYSGTWHCFKDIVKNEGVFALWKGTTPRLARLMFSGGIVFTIYEETMKLLSYL